MKHFPTIALAFAMAAAIPAAAQNPPRTWKVETDRPDAIYRCGETATFTVTLLSTNNLSQGVDLRSAAVKFDNFGPHVLTNAVFDLSATNSFPLSGTIREPGFLRIVLPGTRNHEADPCDFSVGFDPERIRKGSPSPDDFDEFWAKAVRDFDAAVPPDPQLVPVPERSQGAWNYWRVSFAAPHGTRVYGFLSIPKDASAEKKYPVRFNVPAAGTGPWTFRMDGDPDAIRMMMSVHPFDPPDNQEENRRLQDKVKAGLKERYGTDNYTIAGMDVSREDSYFYRALLGINRAVDWIASRPEADLSNFTYSGTSQGGGFGLYLLGLNRHFTKGALFVPALADTMGRLAGRQSGWGNPLKDDPPGSKAGRERNAPYFDGANFASRIRCPVRVAVGFSDCTCAPCAVYAAYNEIHVADKAILHGIGMTHGCFRKFYDELGAWIREPATPPPVASPVTFSTPFGDGMVLQRGRPVPVWGTAAPGESVVVRFAGQEKSATADGDGRWRIDLDPMPECAEGRELSAESATGGRMSVADVLVGEVWFVSGQSNCELPLVGNNPHFSDRQGILVANMTHRPLIRFARTAASWSAEPCRELRQRAEWRKCVPENLRKPAAFSAMGVYFALDVFAETGIPIGLVGAYLGSTNIEPWIPREGFDGVPGAEWCRDWQTMPPGSPVTNLVATGHVNALNRQPSVMWNKMVAPWTPMAARGVLWYQGCSNSSRGKDDGSGDWYRRMMHALYDSWSRAFENPSMRLYFVQLAPFDDWWDVQSCQAAFAAEEPNAAMVTTCDIGNLHDIHPNEKATIGKRLAALALKRDYGFDDLVADAPALRQCMADGGTVRLDFSNASGWWLYNANWSVDVPFEIADENGDWHPARLMNTVNGFTNTVPWKTKGAIDGGGTLVLSADGVTSPATVRYLRKRPWTGFLYSTDSGLPLGPFEAKVYR